MSRGQKGDYSVWIHSNGVKVIKSRAPRPRPGPYSSLTHCSDLSMNRKLLSWYFWWCCGHPFSSEQWFAGRICLQFVLQFTGLGTAADWKRTDFLRSGEPVWMMNCSAVHALPFFFINQQEAEHRIALQCSVLPEMGRLQ
jgi:hypothetical protein